MEHHSYVAMFFIMILSGLLSTMSVWADKTDDIRISLNDVYMIGLMTGWMFLFMGIYYQNVWVGLFGAVLASANLWAIRTQFMVSPEQYLQGMIPHHSMAVHMSKKLLEKQTHLNKFAQSIIDQQEVEIAYMKRL